MSYATLMTVMVPREKWTDERLDDLGQKVDQGLSDLKAEMTDRFDRLETHTDIKIREVNARLDRQGSRTEKGFGELNQRFDRMQFTLIGSAAAIIAALIGLIATQL